jgi:hypothetical protein
MASRTRPRAPSSVRRCISSSRNKVSVFRGAGRQWRVLAALVKDTYLRWNRVCVRFIGDFRRSLWRTDGSVPR